MRRGRIFIFLALILIFGLAAVAVIYFRFLQPSQETPVVVATPTPIDLVNVIIVTQRVPRGNVLDETVLGMIPIQRDLMIQGYFTDVAVVVGRRARVDLEPNMLLTSGMIVDTTAGVSETGSNAALLIPRGMVAVSMPIKALTSVSYAPQPGDHVNVIVTMRFIDLDTEYQAILPNKTGSVIAPGPVGEGGEDWLTGRPVPAYQGRTELDPLLEQSFYVLPSERQRPRLVSQAVIQDGVVLGIGYFPLPGQGTDIREDESEEPTPEAEVPPVEGELQPTPAPLLPEVITLIVTPQDAITLNYLVQLQNVNAANLTLVLRSPNDDSRVQTEAATLDFLLKQYNIPVPVKLPYGVEPRIDNLILPKLPGEVTPVPAPEQ